MKFPKTLFLWPKWQLWPCFPEAAVCCQCCLSCRSGSCSWQRPAHGCDYTQCSQRPSKPTEMGTANPSRLIPASPNTAPGEGSPNSNGMGATIPLWNYSGIIGACTALTQGGDLGFFLLLLGDVLGYQSYQWMPQAPKYLEPSGFACSCFPLNTQCLIPWGCPAKPRPGLESSTGELLLQRWELQKGTNGCRKELQLNMWHCTEAGKGNSGKKGWIPGKPMCQQWKHPRPTRNPNTATATIILLIANEYSQVASKKAKLCLDYFGFWPLQEQMHFKPEPTKTD